MNNYVKLLVYALRYSLPRSSYALDDVLNVLEEEMSNLEGDDLVVIFKDLEEAILDERIAQHYRQRVYVVLDKIRDKFKEEIPIQCTKPD